MSVPPRHRVPAHRPFHRPYVGACLRWLLSAALLSLPSAPSAAAGADEGPGHWKLEERGPALGWTVYSRPVEGSRHRRYRLEAHVRAPVASVWRAALRKMHEERFLAPNQRRTHLRERPGELVSHLRLDVPFISDRDVVSVIHWDANASDGAGTLRRIEWSPARGVLPPADDGVVRIESRGFWEFRPAATGGCDVVYEQHAELGNSVPAWLIESRMTDEIVGEFRILRSALAAHVPAVASPPRAGASRRGGLSLLE